VWEPLVLGLPYVYLYLSVPHTSMVKCLIHCFSMTYWSLR
jgi:hypothetical protein